MLIVCSVAAAAQAGKKSMQSLNRLIPYVKGYIDHVWQRVESVAVAKKFCCITLNHSFSSERTNKQHKTNTLTKGHKLHHSFSSGNWFWAAIVLMKHCKIPAELIMFCYLSLRWNLYIYYWDLFCFLHGNRYWVLGIVLHCLKCVYFCVLVVKCTKLVLLFAVFSK